MKVALPPKIKRQIRIQVRKDNAWQQLCARTFESERNLFGTNLLASGTTDMAMRTDPGFYMVLLRRAVRADHNRAAGVVFGDPGDELRVFFQ